jgi:pseudaminic acid synthase
MATSFKLRGKHVGAGAPVFMVAELSANHGGSLDVARRTVEAAAKAGADAIKLQTYTADTLTLASSAPPFVVKTKNVWAGRTLHDLYREAMTPWEWHAELKELAESLGLEFFSTPFDATAVEYLEHLGVPCHKVASFELTDLPLVEAVAARGKPVIMSTGMASLGDIEAAVRVCRDVDNDDLVLLRCVSSYPASAESMNLASLATLKSFGTIIGLSDHTRDPVVAITATALGAKVIEKHFILDRTLGGPDSFFSLEPGEFRAMVDAVRIAESALGKISFGPSPEEAASTAFRRSLFVARDVKRGSVLTCDDVRSVRPADGLPARHLPEVLGHVATEDCLAGTPVTWQLVGHVPPSPKVSLRSATPADLAVFSGWRGDAAAASVALGGAEQLAAWDDAGLVGEVRLGIAVHGAREVSVTVAPGRVGHGLGQALLTAAAFCASPGVHRLVARVSPDDEKGVRALKRGGFYGFVERREAGVPWLVCERHVGAFTGAR